MRPLRVVHIATRYGTGGSERRLRDAVGALSGPRYHQHVVVGRDSDIERALTDFAHHSVSVERHLVRSPHPYHDLAALRRIARLLQNDRVDVVNTCQSKAGILGRLAARWARVPVIFHSLTMLNFGPGFARVSSVLFRGAEQLVGRWTDAYFVLGTQLRDQFLAAGISIPERYHVIRSSIDVELFERTGARGRDAARRQLGLEPDEVLIAYVGLLEQRKGVLDLPRYQRALERELRSPVRLLVAGEGPLRKPLESEFGAAGVTGGARFLGHTDRVAEVIAAANCVVLLSRTEGLGQVLVQAMATRRPFVSYAVTGPAELIALGGRGSVVAAGDWRAAARATAALLSGEPPEPVNLEDFRNERVRERYRSAFESYTGALAAGGPRRRRRWRWREKRGRPSP